MKIAIYVDFENEAVYSEKEYEKAIQDFIEEGLNSLAPYCWDFDEWLDDQDYSLSDIFHLNEDEKELILQDYKRYADENIRSNWNCKKKEIEI